MVKPKKKLTKKKDYIFAVGRRKTATARVRLYQKKGPILINNQPIDQYFSGTIAKRLYLKPLQATKTLDRLSFTIKVQGSGKEGQLKAVIHGISRALLKLDEKQFRPVLKQLGVLTRDSRKKERRKVGTGGKARRKKQSPKR